MKPAPDAIICGAGIAGVSAAFFLSRAGLRNILLVDERPPLSFTSDRSTECYRNWWPDAAMLALMNRSISLMEALADQSGNVFRLNRRGYLYVTGDEAKVPEMTERAKRTSALGAGRLRIHTDTSSDYAQSAPEGFHDEPEGADLLIGPDLILKHFPYLTKRSAAALHARRAGWLSAQQLGMYLLEQGRSLGVQFSNARLEAVQTAGGRVQGIKLAGGEEISAPILINAAGPYLKQVGAFMREDLPVQTELHLKVGIKDALGVVGREAPLLIWDDPLLLHWELEERQALAGDPDSRWLTGPFPSGAHTRPEGGLDSQNILLLWDYHTQAVEPVWPPSLDDMYPEIALRGLATMLPRFQEYLGRLPRPQLDGGYYTRTPENRLLAGPLETEGAYVLGALSGYGIMAACGAGELLAAHVTGSRLPAYARDFSPRRYQDDAYLEEIKSLDGSGQL